MFSKKFYGTACFPVHDDVNGSQLSNRKEVGSEYRQETGFRMCWLRKECPGSLTGLFRRRRKEKADHSPLAAVV